MKRIFPENSDVCLIKAREKIYIYINIEVHMDYYTKQIKLNKLRKSN